MNIRIRFLIFLIPSIFIHGCEPIKKAPEATESKSKSGPVTPKLDKSQGVLSPEETTKRKQQYAQMEQSVQAVASMATSKKGPEYDFKFEMPSDDWVKEAHGAGDAKSSVWLFSSKKESTKILISCAGQKEAPEFAKSAQSVYDSSVKKHPEVTKEWKVGNFVLRRSFIGFIDDRHGEVTITAFAPTCVIEFNIGSETMDRDDLFKFGDGAAEAFIKKNPSGGYPTNHGG
jgi:hypothetical protein